jgi:hypothetical protein
MARKLCLLLLCLSVLAAVSGCYIEPTPYGVNVYPYGSYYVHPRPSRYYYHYHPRYYY